MKIWPFTKLTRAAAYNIISLLISLSFTIASSFLIWQNMVRFPLAVPFWFSKPQGESWLAAPNFLWLIPTISVLLVIFNSLVASYFWSRERVLSLLLASANPIISGLLFYTLLEIVLIAT